MEIVSIFAKNLYAFKYEGQKFDEFERLFESWFDPEYLEEFFDKNKNDLETQFWHYSTVELAIRKTWKEAYVFQRKMLEIADNAEKGCLPDLETLFRPLDNYSSGLVELSLSKAYGIEKPSWLRIYAVRIERNVYVVTGGAIKLVEQMQECSHLKEELSKMKRAVCWLRKVGIIDREGLFEND